MWDQYPKQIRTTPARCVDGQALVITPQDSTLHTLNETGTYIWEQSDGTRTLSDIVKLLCEEYGDDEGESIDVNAIRTDAETFVKDAEKKGILRVLSAPISPPGA
ncbi:MAG: PqqD family protein [Deltaproteobacteria bacterium]|nr:PqqD family protein [Deltaproteobacteria bacterium]